MFTFLAFVALFWLLKHAQRAHHEEVEEWIRRQPSDDDLVRYAIKATRQDVQLIAFLLMGILLMLGVIADNIVFADRIRSTVGAFF
jgi:hypothetical protein